MRPDTEADAPTVDACPNCDSSHVERVTRDPNVSHRCGDCGKRFDEPVEREALHSKPPDPHTIGGKVHRMDASDLGVSD